jgi:outer membrane protein OmpA-like peptidoglycan-associated protein
MKPTNMRKMQRLVMLLIVSVMLNQGATAQQQGLNKPLGSKYVPSGDIKWSMFGLNRVHVQDFGITDQYTDTCNCGESRRFFDKANVNVGFSVYRNFSKKLAFSGDLALGYGYISRKAPTVQDKKQSWMQTVHADLYYQLSDNRLQLQPYLFGGLHGSQRAGKVFASLPVGMGARYMVFNDNGMITAQVGYGMGLTNGIRNSIIYSWGLYVNMSRKKKVAGKETTQDMGGCCAIPPVDTDCDGVTDAADKCPTVAGSVSNNGCPLNDRDHDGIMDENDKCPDTPGPVSNMGCPVADRDGDGLADNIDKCPDVKGPASNNGCPIEDKDGDGIADDKDKCPDQAGPVNNMGCPITDRDGDGVPDLIDRCPDIFGAQYNDGCPTSSANTGGYSSQLGTTAGSGGFVPGYGGGFQQGTKRILKDTVQFIIYFDFDKFDLTSNSYQILSEVIEYLKRNDDQKVLLVGHTDLEGDVAYNVKLSENRIRTSRNYLMSYGIEAGRISTDFHGKSKPAIPTFDKSLAWKNRRVEIFIVKK